MRRINDSRLKEKYITMFALHEQISESIISTLELQSFQKGEYLCRQEENLAYFYLLLSGKLQIDQFHLEGNHAVFSFETPFSIIGDLELFEGTQIVSNVQALGDCLVFAAPAGVIRDFGYNDASFLRFVINYLVKKLRFSSTLLSQVPLSVKYRFEVALKK